MLESETQSYVFKGKIILHTYVYAYGTVSINTQQLKTQTDPKAMNFKVHVLPIKKDKIFRRSSYYRHQWRIVTARYTR